MPDAVAILDIGPLVIEATPRPSHFDRRFDTRIRVDAHPFSGVVETIFTDADLLQFAEELDGLRPDGDAMLGGGRACEVRLVVNWQNDVVGGHLAVECTVTPSGDDPFPLVRFLAVDVDPFAPVAAARLRDLATVDPWPPPVDPLPGA